MSDYQMDSEIVFGLVTPLGVNHDDVRSRLKSALERYNYSTEWLHLSELMWAFAGTPPPKNCSEFERINRSMTLGNDLRKEHKRKDIMALLAINEILAARPTDQDNKRCPRGRVAYIIKSLKHPDEVETLRTTYGKGFVLLGISSKESARVRYLVDQKGMKEDEASELVIRDDRENDESDKYGKFGQSTRDVFQLSDFFLTIDSTIEFEEQLKRALELLFANPVVPPTLDEYAMFMAYAASLRSADLSRQVGAVITNEFGDIVSTGANDVPKFSGGLYWPAKDCDNRDYVKGFDSNEEQKRAIALKILEVFEKLDGSISDEENFGNYRKQLEKTGVLDITEYGRAVHAEMEALMSAARNGTSVRGSTLYTTTFPCHNCAKHIIAAGAKNVVFIEPYPKSFATKLHEDEICLDNDDSSAHKVRFKQFAGVGPRNFIDLFSTKLGNGRKLVRKDKQTGKVSQWKASSAQLRVPLIPISYIERELLLDLELEDLKQEKGHEK